MLHSRLLNAMKKTGAKIEKREKNAFEATKEDGRKVRWYVQAGFSCKEKLSAICVHTPSIHTDIRTDCFCDTFYYTIKSAVFFMKD
jgi:hypothetical protein